MDKVVVETIGARAVLNVVSVGRIGGSAAEGVDEERAAVGGALKEISTVVMTAVVEAGVMSSVEASSVTGSGSSVVGEIGSSGAESDVKEVASRRATFGPGWEEVSGSWLGKA